MIKLNVLTNFYGGFYSSTEIAKRKELVYSGQYRKMSMDIEKLKQYANNEGIELCFMFYPEIDLTKDYTNQLFIFTSSEDFGLIYKGYMEDVLLGLKLKGAVLIPDWKYMRAHHNKVMMEELRDIQLSSIDTGIHSRFYGCNEDFLNELDKIQFPCVYKSAEGAGSAGVALFKDKDSALRFIEKAHRNHKITLKERLYLKTGKLQPSPYSNYRRKFVIQNFISGLNGDYKVLVFGEKYYALSRENRENDFRASGGGRLNFEPKLPQGIFDFAKSVFDALNVPILSLDIANDGNRFYLIEFQCLNFGTATLDDSTHYYKLENNCWVRHDETSVLEKEFVTSLKRFLKKNYLISK